MTTTNGGSEIDAWRKAWKTPQAQADTIVKNPDAVRHELEKQQRNLRLLHVFELAFALAITVGAAIILERNFTRERAVWAVLVWVLTLLAAGFSLWNWRVLWSVDNQSTAELVIAHRKRCVARLRAARFGSVLLAIQLAISAPWFTWRFWQGEMPGLRYGIVMAVLASLAGVFTVMIVRSQRRARMEILRLEEFERCVLDESQESNS
jgi:hypothetical protein